MPDPCSISMRRSLYRPSSCSDTDVIENSDAEILRPPDSTQKISDAIVPQASGFSLSTTRSRRSGFVLTTNSSFSEHNTDCLISNPLYTAKSYIGIPVQSFI